MMSKANPLTILCVSSYHKGQEFMRTCKAMGCRVLLLTVEKLRNVDWPNESIDELFTMPEDLLLQHLIYTVSYMARSRPINRIVALDEFDMENVSALREHLRLPGMGLTTVRHFRDKLAMRGGAREAGILVPDFVHVLNHDNLREFMARVPGPWPRAAPSRGPRSHLMDELHLYSLPLFPPKSPERASAADSFLNSLFPSARFAAFPVFYCSTSYLSIGQHHLRVLWPGYCKL